MSTSTEIPALNLEKNLVEWERATSLIPGGALGIRRPYNFVEGEFPIFIDHGQGGQIVDVDGNTFTDFLCAYGPIILGYREQEVDEAVISRIREKGFCFSLTQVLQNELAEVLRDIIPCAQMSLFVKTGSDATSVAVRLARAFTQRTGIIRCGYHGWHDWCVEVKGGIPAKLYEDVREFPYNDLDALESLLKQHGEDTAAIILTPYGHPLAAPMEDPAPGFLEGAKKLAHCYGALLIFDEIRTGFRLALGGAQERFGVTPDVAVFGKAMANGYAIAAVTGRKDIMMMGEKEVFVSSTYFPNSLGYVAALKTIEILQRDQVIPSIEKKGQYFMTGVQQAIEKSGISAQLSGLPQMNFITFPKDQTGLYKKQRKAFFTHLIRQGVFLQPYHHGYICHRHTLQELEKALRVIEQAFMTIREFE